MNGKSIRKTIAAILAAITLFGVFPFSAFAGTDAPAAYGEGDTLEEALSKINVCSEGDWLDWLMLPGWDRTNDDVIRQK